MLLASQPAPGFFASKQLNGWILKPFAYGIAYTAHLLYCCNLRLMHIPISMNTCSTAASRILICCSPDIESDREVSRQGIQGQPKSIGTVATPMLLPPTFRRPNRTLKVNSWQPFRAHPLRPSALYRCLQWQCAELCMDDLLIAILVCLLVSMAHCELIAAEELLQQHSCQAETSDNGSDSEVLARPSPVHSGNFAIFPVSDILYGLINAIVGAPTMISFAAIIFSVRFLLQTSFPTTLYN